MYPSFFGIYERCEKEFLKLPGVIAEIPDTKGQCDLYIDRDRWGLPHLPG
jgi:hypothetical protein